MREWRTGGIEVGDIIRLDNGTFEERLGYGWARGRLKHGDTIVAIAHAGDCFWKFLLVETSKTRGQSPKLRLENIGKPFGAYTLGRQIGRLSEDEISGLNAGAIIEIALPSGFDEKSTMGANEFMTLRDLRDTLNALSDDLLNYPIELESENGPCPPGGRISFKPDIRRANILPPT